MTRLHHRATVDGDDAGSLMLALLLVILGSMLAAVMLPMFLTQLSASQANQRIVHELDAAEAGIDVAIGHIRAANDGNGNGVISALPCGPLTGSVSAAATARYSVSIGYYSANPQGQSASWLSSNSINCASGGTGTASTPTYALLTSKGTDTSTGSFTTVPVRTLIATYVFTTSNQHITGGAIHYLAPGNSNPDLCLDAGSGAPAAGTAVTMQQCVTGSAAQKFAYTTSLTLLLVSSVTSTQPTGLCLDGGGSPETANTVVKLQVCGASVKPQQEWSYGNYGFFQGTDDGQNVNTMCINVQTVNTVGSGLILSTNCGSAGVTQNFSPEAAVGAGAAGASSNQLVNFNQFGRCLDVTNQFANSPFLIAWPCKQAPNPTNILWNQVYTLPTGTSGSSSATGLITTNPGSLYCLQSPLSTASGQYVTVSSCSNSSTAANLTWTVYGNTGDYATSYIVKDSSGNCLTPTDPTATPPDLYTSGIQVSKIIMQPCNGSTLQKWNAPATLNSPTPLTDIHEK